MDERKLENLVPKRYLKPLSRAGINSLEDLLKITPHELYEIKGCGLYLLHNVKVGLALWDMAMKCTGSMTFSESMNHAIAGLKPHELTT